jgi:hypothetical protein
MSEVTNVILVSESVDHIRDRCKRMRIDGYLFPVNPKWSGLAVKDGFEEGRTLAKSLSKKLEAYVFQYEYCEDFYWSYDLYYKGKRCAYLYLSFESDEDSIKQANFPLLKTICAKQEEINKMEQILAGDYFQMELDLIECFKRAFQFESIEWISYEYIEDWDSEELARLGAVLLKPAKRKSKAFKDKVIQLFREPLHHIGFTEEEIHGEHLIKFGRSVNGFKYWVMFDIGEKDTLILDLLVPNPSKAVSRWKMNNQLFFRLEYKTVRELGMLLETYGYPFINRANEYVNHQPIEIGNIDELYVAKCDPFFEKYGFQRVLFDQNIVQGGSLVYRKDDVSFIFKHYNGSANIESRVLIGQDTYVFQYVLLYFMEELGLQGDEWEYFSFQNEEEFVAQLDRLLKYIEWSIQSDIKTLVKQKDIPVAYVGS